AVKENRIVKLEVKNAFGRTATRSFSFVRPQPDLSGATSRLEPQPAADAVLHRATGLVRQLPKPTGAVQ
ncbi:MAG TPA: hypothetical protein VNW92_16075, partial [Polyangiaceae bacterium]|nr:hypothetical protein [Polyangiaceae bacterium]